MLRSGDAPVLFSAVLRPSRSASPDSVRIVVGLTAAVLAGAGFAFVASRAWPVVGFLGLEVLLLYGALRLNHRAARAFETIDLTERELTVRRVTHRGSQQIWSFQPYWLRIAHDDSPDGGGPVELRSHGRTVTVGAFLSPSERRDLAKALGRALAPLSRLPQPTRARP